MTADPEEARRALEAYHLHCLCDIWAYQLETMAQRHPEKLRQIFAHVFSCQAVESVARRALTTAREAQEACREAVRLGHEAQDLLRQVIDGIDRVERRQDMILERRTA